LIKTEKEPHLRLMLVEVRLFFIYWESGYSLPDQANCATNVRQTFRTPPSSWLFVFLSPLECAQPLFSICRGLVNHVDGFLRDGVKGGYRLGVGLKGALRNDQVGELGGDVDVGSL
jgi:hypothetical protein